MRILFVTGRPFFPDLFGGAEKSMRQLILGLSKRGHTCEGICVISGRRKSLLFGLGRALTARRLLSLRDDEAGFPMFRTRSWLLKGALHARVKVYQPDVVLTQLGMADDIADWCDQLGMTSLLFIRDTQDINFNEANPKRGQTRYVSNSVYTAEWAAKEYGIESVVVYPPIDVSAARPPLKPEFVTFINPVHEKGLDLAIAIAEKLPEVKFLFVESWPLSSEDVSVLENRLRSVQNVQFWRRRIDVQSVYDVTKILIVPSLWEEPFGRVVIEAQACGIPVIGRGVGGITESVGDGGIVLTASEGADGWSETILELLEDDQAYERNSRAALRNALHGPWNPDRVVDIAESILYSQPR